MWLIVKFFWILSQCTQSLPSTSSSSFFFFFLALLRFVIQVDSFRLQLYSFQSWPSWGNGDQTFRHRPVFCRTLVGRWRSWCDFAGPVLHKQGADSNPVSDSTLFSSPPSASPPLLGRTASVRPAQRRAVSGEVQAGTQIPGGGGKRGSCS